MLQVILCETCIFLIFVLTLQTDFAAHWCVWFSANDSSIEQVCPPSYFNDVLCIKFLKICWWNLSKKC